MRGFFCFSALRRFALALLLALIPLSLLATASYAQEGFHVAVSPSKQEITAEPGSYREFAINVENFTDVSYPLDVYFADYAVQPNGAVVYEKPGHFSYSCATWMSTDIPRVTLPPRGTAETSTTTTNFRLRVPPGAEPGGHYGVIIFQQGAPSEGPAPVKFSARIAAMVMVTVPGQIVRDGEIKSVSVTSRWLWPTRKSSFLPSSPTVYSVVFENKGNVHLTVKCKLTYRPSFGWGTGTIDLPETTVLPGTTRNFTGEIPKPPLLGSYKFTARVSYGPSIFEFDTTKTKSCGFNVYPLLTIVLLVLVLPILIIALVIFIRRMLGKIARARKERAEEESRERSWTSFADIWKEEQGEAEGEAEEKPGVEPEKEKKEEGEEGGEDVVADAEGVGEAEKTGPEWKNNIRKWKRLFEPKSKQQNKSDSEPNSDKY